MRELDIKDFLAVQGTILDVRSPKEFEHARIPGALNLPLFTDSERAEVGTLYKHSGHDAAVEKGLELVGPKLKNFVTHAKEILKGNPAKIYCARGGMRSSSMQWLLETAGIPTCRLNGGYKAFRRMALTLDFTSANLIVIGGFSGSAKTTILHTLKTLGAQILDLERLASHRGSSYGMLQGLKQSSIEQFENEIADCWLNFDQSKPIYVEDESRMIGTCRIMNDLFLKMRTAPLIFIEKSFEIRVNQLVKDYSLLSSQELIEATKRISKHLGSSLTNEVIHHIESGFLKPAIEIVLKYYDSTYLYGMSKRAAPIRKISFDREENDDVNLKFAKEIYD